MRGHFGLGLGLKGPVRGRGTRGEGLRAKGGSGVIADQDARFVLKRKELESAFLFQNGGKESSVRRESLMADLVLSWGEIRPEGWLWSQCCGWCSFLQVGSLDIGKGISTRILISVGQHKDKTWSVIEYVIHGSYIIGKRRHSLKCSIS